MKIKRWGAAVVGSGLVLGATAAAVEARPRSVTCDRSVSGVVRGVVVKDGATCWVHHARVDGPVQVEGNGRLVIERSEVTGPLRIASGASFVAVTESKVGDISGANSDFAYNRTQGLFLEKANVGALRYGVYNSDVDAHQVTFRGPVNVSSGAGRFDDVEVHGDLTTTNHYSSAFLLRLGKIHGMATLSNSVVCGGRFDGNVTISGGAPVFGTNGSTCGGNRVAGTLSIKTYHDNHAAGAPRVSGNVVRGHATGTNGTYHVLAGSHNRFRGGASGALAKLPNAHVADVPAPDFSRQLQAVQEVRDAG